MNKLSKHINKTLFYVPDKALQSQEPDSSLKRASLVPITALEYKQLLVEEICSKKMLMNRATINDNKNGNREVGCLKINYVQLFRHSGLELFEIEKFST